MFSDKTQIIAVTASILLIIFIFTLIRKRRLKEEYSLLWLFFGFVFLFLSSWKGSVDFIADLIGIAYSPAALLLVLIIGIFFIMVEFSMIISKLTDLNKNLAQDVGILKEELESLKKQIDKGGVSSDPVKQD
jgi:hypothetical protein